MKIFFLFPVLCFSAMHGRAQPYIDLVGAKYVYSPDMGFINHSKQANELNYLNISATLPLLSRDKKDAIVFSPFYEGWDAKIPAISEARNQYRAFALPVSFIKSIKNSPWTINLTPILRTTDWNKNTGLHWQFGGAAIAMRKAPGKQFTLKFGVYLNRDYFGLFVMPLAGVDWQINPHTNLFGILPGNLTLEHQVSKRFYFGAVFRAITNSYADSGSRYFRVDENQLGLFGNCYLTNHLVLNIETGHSLFRQLRTGMKGEGRTDWMANDNVYVKAGLVYRMRLR